MNKLYTFGDVILEAGLDDMEPNEWAATENPERLEYVDWNDRRPSMAYLQARYNEWVERHEEAMHDYCVIHRYYPNDIPARLQRWVDETRDRLNAAYEELRKRALLES